jgi:hypothetical protein
VNQKKKKEREKEEKHTNAVFDFDGANLAGRQQLLRDLSRHYGVRGSATAVCDGQGSWTVPFRFSNVTIRPNYTGPYTDHSRVAKKNNRFFQISCAA